MKKLLVKELIQKYLIVRKNFDNKHFLELLQIYYHEFLQEKPKSMENIK